MKSVIAVNVSDLLPKEFVGLPQLLRADSQGDPLGKVSEELLGYASGVMAGEVRKALDVGIFDWLACAWSTARELHKYKAWPTAEGSAGTKPAAAAKDATFKASPGEGPTLVSLGEHSLSCAAHPVVTVTVAGRGFRIDKFQVELEAELHAAALVIQDGYIAGLQAGDGFASATLKFAGYALHDPLKSKAIHAPGKIRFKAPGYRIV